MLGAEQKPQARLSLIFIALAILVLSIQFLYHETCSVLGHIVHKARKTGAKAAAKVVAATPSKATLPGHVPELKAFDTASLVFSVFGSFEQLTPLDFYVPPGARTCT